MISAAATKQIRRCKTCGAEIDADTSLRQCPRCLLGLGLSTKRSGVVENPLFDVLSKPQNDFDFEILDRLGRGGMGVVYRARQRSLNRIVALKVIAGGLTSPAAMARFRQEAETAAKLNHPNIVGIYEVGENATDPYLVMRLVEGGSLTERLCEFALPAPGHLKKDRAILAQKRIARLIATVARAVHHAHEAGVLHRDLKPSNILIDREGNSHLTDFGIAKLVDRENELTQTAELLGTPSYMAPEQAAGKSVSHATDIYSLGAILYELLTGSPPFRGKGTLEVLRQVLESEPEQPRSINPEIARDLSIICVKCLDKEPSRRYLSARALAEDLERWQRQEPILARQAGPLLRLRRWTARNPALATLILALIAGIVLTSVLLARANHEKTRKSIALAILRTETARQLQEIWDSPSPFFAIKSETLAAMAGNEPAELLPIQKRFTIGLITEGRPVDRVLGSAPLLENVERRITALTQKATRLDFRLYKEQSAAISDLVLGKLDYLQINARGYLRAKEQAPALQLVAKALPSSAMATSAVIFARKDSGIKSLADLRGRSFLFGTVDSTRTFWTKVRLAQAGLHARDLAKSRYLDQSVDTRSSGGAAPALELGNPFSAMTPVEAVLDRVYDAGVAPQGRFLQVAVRDQLVPILIFEDSNYLIASRSGLAPEEQQAFQTAFVEEKDRRVLVSFPGEPGAYAAANDDSLAPIRKNLVWETAFDGGLLLQQNPEQIP